MFEEKDAELKEDEVKESETEESEVENPEDSTEEPEEKNETDYKALLEAERKRREKAESSAQYHKDKYKELRNNADEEDEDEERVTKKDLATLEANLTRNALKSYVGAEVSKVASNEDEAELILYHYNNSVMPTGDVQKDVLRARLIANESRIQKENEELFASLQAKDTRQYSSVGAGQKPALTAKEPVVDRETEKLLKLNNMTWNPKTRTFANEKGSSYDPATGKVTDPRRS